MDHQGGEAKSSDSQRHTHPARPGQSRHTRRSLRVRYSVGIKGRRLLKLIKKRDFRQEWYHRELNPRVSGMRVWKLAVRLKSQTVPCHSKNQHQEVTLSIIFQRRPRSTSLTRFLQSNSILIMGAESVPKSLRVL